jgi:hypothetical protein
VVPVQFQRRVSGIGYLYLPGARYKKKEELEVTAKQVESPEWNVGIERAAGRRDYGLIIIWPPRSVRPRCCVHNNCPTAVLWYYLDCTVQ